MTVFPRYLWFLSPRIDKTVNTKTPNSEGRLYILGVAVSDYNEQLILLFGIKFCDTYCNTKFVGV